MTRELLTATQAAELCGIGEQTLGRYANSGKAPAPIRLGDGPRPMIRYRMSELLAWIEGGCKPVQGKNE
jgi:predicted DNA-binding transcriptional regulator AlpA